MKSTNLLFSILIILMFVIQPVSAENKLISQPFQNHSFSFLDDSYVITYRMETDVLADRGRGHKWLATIVPLDGSCSLTTTPNLKGEINSLTHSGTVFTADLRSSLYFGGTIDSWGARQIGGNQYDDPKFAFAVDSDNPYFCFTARFLIGYSDGNDILADKLLIKVYENATPIKDEATNAVNNLLPFNFLSLLIALPILVLLRRKQL